MILSRYIIREIYLYFAIILVIVMGIYLSVDFIEKIDNFMEAGVPLSRAGIYFICKLPLIIYQITPVGILLAVMITFGLMAANKELIALRSCGISLVSLIAPIARCGFAATLFMVVLAEGLAPLSLPQANRIWLQEVRGQNAAVNQQDIWLKGEQSILHLRYYEPHTQTAKGLTFHRLNRQFQLLQRIDAETGRYKNGLWQLQKGMQQERRPNGQYDIRIFEKLDVSLGITPEDLAQVVPQTDEMNFMQLHQYISKVEDEGYDTTHYRVDLIAKSAFPFISLILTMIGAGLGARGKFNEGLAVSIAYGIGIAFLYWTAFSFSLSLGYAGMLPPIIAAWSVNFIALCLAGYLLINAD